MFAINHLYLHLFFRFALAVIANKLIFLNGILFSSFLNRFSVLLSPGSYCFEIFLYFFFCILFSFPQVKEKKEIQDDLQTVNIPFGLVIYCLSFSSFSIFK